MTDMHQNILYQDEWLIAIDKPPGMLVHPGKEPEPDEQIALKSIRNYLKQYVFVVHRLDRPTSGVLIFAKDKDTQSKLSILFQNREVDKKYLAVVAGEAPEKNSVDLPIKRDEESEAAPSLTHFTRLNLTKEGALGDTSFSLLDVDPVTGRFHQIRRHLFWTGFPIMGDYLYGSIEDNDRMAEQTGVKRMMLMAKSLEFIHPQTGEEVKIEAELPEDFLKFS